MARFSRASPPFRKGRERMGHPPFENRERWGSQRGRSQNPRPVAKDATRTGHPGLLLGELFYAAAGEGVSAVAVSSDCDVSAIGSHTVMTVPDPLELISRVPPSC